MTFFSILFDNDDLPKETEAAPACFSDLNLDQIVKAVTARKKDYRLAPFFYTPLRSAETIRYRHEVMRDLENESLLAHIETFAEKMVIVGRYLGLVEKLEFHHHKQGWFLDAALVYCEAIGSLAENLAQINLTSRGLLALREYLTQYVTSPAFQSLTAEACKVKEGLAGVRYSIIIESGKFKVLKYEDEPDYSVEVEKTFAKFQQGAVKDYRSELGKASGMNHIEAKILEFVTLLYPEAFAALDRFRAGHTQFVDEALRTFDREIQFYIAYLDGMRDLRHKGLIFCYPEVGASKEVFVRDGFDLALAQTLLFSEKPVICNDFALTNPERVMVVTGPNQGGKTTFARMFGQLHYLASLGLPVPGRAARLFLCDNIFTHFERAEDIRNLRSKLQDDLVRLHEIFSRATPDSLIILNEVFASTSLKDAVFMSKEIMRRALELDLPGVWVTFIDELASFGEKTVSMVSAIVPEDPARRTFKIVRRPADGLAYALSLAEKHRLTYAQLKERIRL
ncbi:MAG: DNA mismatch repair protein MutS [Anaerolineae bacterium CG_4_9_14_3_um_filter_57_17]|nr:DNA mismatch repair protein MutS [bacterium]NCT21312.1 DNA mismatch repair protein MutS [bacterium]OIO84833.1 MAG: DNA mismatch repair protein MutS [Anaerolineae bacterium CG2_30_57_67]PJB68770.1 MAG: DNA mismatch repair protein MutS [Anaerolineae bacterium CG_4_9_14_3_um_filter_57_17]